MRPRLRAPHGPQGGRAGGPVQFLRLRRPQRHPHFQETGCVSGTMNDGDLNRLQQTIGIPFKDPGLLKQAFTHSSYVNEHRDARHNERLEYLGDAVLELAVSEYLFRRFPNMPEGELTLIRASAVCEPSLHDISRRLNFGEFVLLGRGEEMGGGRERPALLADVFEAFIGALYLDQGYETVVRFLERHLFPNISRHYRLDAKS